MRVFAFAAAVFALQLSIAHPGQQLSPPVTIEPCFVLRLGPAVGNAPRPVAVPVAIALRPSGRVAAAVRTSDVLSEQSAALGGEWESRGPDSVVIGWRPAWLGGSVELRFVRAEGNLRGRYALHGHQADAGRGLARGNAIALRATCADGRLSVHDRSSAEQRLIAWNAAQRPDTALARAETRAAFAASLRETPVLSISLMNYRIAEFACQRRRPPNSLSELRVARPADNADPDAEWLGDLVWRDAWSRPIEYWRRGTGYEVRSLGPDGRLGTADDLVGRYDTIPLKRYRKDGCR